MLAEAVIQGRPGAIENYMNLLKAGGSDYPYELLKRAGVDLASAVYSRAVFTRMNSIMDRREANATP